MKEDLELAEYLRTYDQANAELKAGTDEMVPDAVVDRLAAGAPPLRMWREYRGLSQQALADAAGIGKSYIRQLGAGTRKGSVGNLRTLASAMNLDLDDLQPWTQGVDLAEPPIADRLARHSLG